MKEKELLESGLVDEQFLSDLPNRRQRAAWVLNESLVSVGAWEPLSHRRRLGTTQVDDEKFYAYEHSEQFVKEILAIGGNLLITAYDKNYYVDEEEYELKKQLVAHCKKHGLRLGVYIRADNIQTEVMADRLKNEDLLARKADGHSFSYGSQEWRKDICFHKPGNIEAFKASIHRAIIDLGVDMLHLDGFGVGGTETYNACRCDACRRDFTKFLIRRWGDDSKSCKHRFGHTRLEGIEPPGFASLPAVPTGRITEPVWQEWIRFRCTWTARVTRIISEYAYELNPDVAILGNAGLAVRENSALLCGYEPETYCRHVDMMCNEDAFDAHIGPEGEIIQRVRQHKMVANGGAFLWNYMHNPARQERHLRLQLSHAAAFNRGRTTGIGFSFACYNDFRLAGDIKRKYADWMKQHWEHFQNLESINDVAVWRELRAMAFAEPVTYATAMRIEQLLIEDRTPFHIVFGDWSSDTQMLVLPNLAILDDAQCARLIQFVERGGSLLIIGQTSILDGWGRRRNDFGLRAILPPQVKASGLVFVQHIAGANDPIKPGCETIDDKEQWTRHQAGAGRVIHIPELVDPSTQPSLFNVDHTYNFGLDLTNWRIPGKSDETREALAWLLDGKQTFTVESERGVISNYYCQPESGSRYVHLVNLNDHVVADTVIKYKLPANTKVYDVSVISPDGDEFQKIDWRMSEDHLVISLERLDVYSVIIVKTQ